MRPPILSIFVAAAVSSWALGCGSNVKEYGRQSDLESVERAYQLQRLGFVCDGRSYADAPAYDPAATGPRPAAVFRNYNSYGSSTRWRPARDVPWTPSKTTEAMLAVCVEYAHSSDAKPEVRVISVHDGRVVAEFVAEVSRSGGDADRHARLLKVITPYVEGPQAP